MSPDTDYLRLGCFGKLPFSPEYLNVHADLPTSRRFRSWLEEGRKAALLDSGADQLKERERGAHRWFLFGLPGSAELLAGVVRASADAGGRREFPFAVFAHVPRRLYHRHYALVPLALRPTWEALDQAWTTLSAVAGEHAFRELVSDTRVPVPDPLRETESHYLSRHGESTADLFQRGDGANLSSFSAQFPTAVTAVKRGVGAGAPRVELPVSFELGTACFETSFWLDLLNHQFLWKKFEPAVFLEGARGARDRKVLLLFEDLRPEDYEAVLGGNGAERLLRPAHVPGETREGGEASGPQTYGALLTTRFSSRNA
jgi:type VI secretion system ImpM family protein